MSNTIGTPIRVTPQEDASKACDIVLSFLKQRRPREYLDEDEHEIMRSLLLRVMTQDIHHVSICYVASNSNAY